VRPGKRPENTFLSKRVIANGTTQASRKNNWLPIFPSFIPLFLFPISFLLFSPVYLFSFSPVSASLGLSAIGTFPFLRSILVFLLCPLDERQILSCQTPRNKLTTNSRREVLDCALTSRTTNDIEKPFFFIPLIAYGNRQVYQIT